MGDSEDGSISISNLICQEDKSLLDDNGDAIHEADEEEEEAEYAEEWTASPVEEEQEEEYLDSLITKETSFDSRSVGSLSGNESSIVAVAVAGDWLKRARGDAIQWILSSNASFSFGHQTAFLAVSYLDRFLARQPIEEGRCWAVMLSAVACLSLAAKMEERELKPLSEFRLGEYQFHSETIERMEFLVLNTLEWRMLSVTPFPFLEYLAPKFQLECEMINLLSRAVRVIFAAIEELNLVDHRPSAIAAAAVLAAADQGLTKKLIESKMSTISLCASLKSEHVFSCYTMMVQESHKAGLKTSKLLISSDLSLSTYRTIVNSPIDVVDNVDSNYSSPTSSKRKRLE